MAENPFSNLYEKVYGRQGLLGFPEGTFKNAEGFEPLGLSPARQALLAFASGALANSGRFTDTPQSGLEGIGAGLGSALGMYQSAIKGLQDQRQIFQEREQNQELKNLVPQLADRARQLGVSEDVIFSATLQANANVRSAITLLNNAISSAKADPKLEPSVFQDEQSGRRFLINPKTGAPTEIKDLPEEKVESSPISMSRSDVMRSPSLSMFSNQMGPNDILQIEPGKNPSILRAPEAKTTPGQVQPLSDEEKQRFQGTDIESKIINPETGQTTFYNSLGKQITEIPEVGSFPEVGQTIEIPNSTELLVHMGEGNYQRTPKEKVKETKESAGFKYIRKGQEGFPLHAPADADEVELSPTGQRTFFKGGFALQAPETKPEVQKFEYLDKTSAQGRFPALVAQMGDNDVIEINPETGKAEIIFAPGADSEDLDYREIVSADGKMRQQGYYRKYSGKLVTDLGMTPVKLDKGLETKDKLKFLIDRHKKPSDRLQAMVSNYESISTAVGAGKPFDDLALIFYIAKMLDPTSVVREGEQMIIRNTGALPDKFISYFTRLKDGKAFTKDQRRNILEFAKRKMDAELKTYNQVVDGVKRDAGENRFNLSYENEVVPALGIIHDKMDTNKTFKKVMDSINNLEDPLGGEEELNTEGTDSGLREIIFDAVDEAIEKRSSKKSTRKKTVLSDEEGDSILD